MAHITKQAARDLIVELRLPQVILDIFDGHPPEKLSFRYGCPEEYYGLDEEQQAHYAGDVVVPFLDNGNFDYVFAYHRQKRAFLRFSVETRTTAEILDAPVYSWQQLMVREFQFFCEDEMTHDELHDLAAQLDFRYVDELIDLAERAYAPNSDTSWLEGCHELVALIGASEAQE